MVDSAVATRHRPMAQPSRPRSLGTRAGPAAQVEIMVVEDERIAALELASCLSDLGYIVAAIVYSGQEAVRQAADVHPDLVLIDVWLEGEMNGLEAARRIRDALNIPVIYMTDGTEPIPPERAEIHDPLSSILKPCGERELHIAIEVALYRQQVDRKLQESEAWLLATLKSVSDAVIATDARGRVRFMNPVAQLLTGWPEREALGKDLGQVFRTVHGETRVPLESPAARALAQGTGTEASVNKVLIGRDEREVWIRDRSAPIQDDRGNVSGVVLVFRDATDRGPSHETLSQYVGELEARNQDLDAFAHTVAHDIKSPLSTIVGCATVLEEECDRMSGAQRQRFLQIISRVGFETCNLVDELLLLATVRSADVTKEPLHMAVIVARAERRLLYMERECEAEIVLPDRWPVALGYEPWVEEVWINYLSNGIKYGGQPPRLALGATVQGAGMVRFWVRDNGPGLADEDRARLFAPFTRLSQARATGHGLGLSIVCRIVEKLGGQVGVESRPGEGSTFWFTLPAAG